MLYYDSMVLKTQFFFWSSMVANWHLTVKVPPCRFTSMMDMGRTFGKFSHLEFCHGTEVPSPYLIGPITILITHPGVTECPVAAGCGC